MTCNLNANQFTVLIAFHSISLERETLQAEVTEKKHTLLPQ